MLSMTLSQTPVRAEKRLSVAPVEIATTSPLGERTMWAGPEPLYRPVTKRWGSSPFSNSTGKNQIKY